MSERFSMFFHAKGPVPANKAKHWIFATVLATIGYILSPLSWWNDLFINVPLAYAFSYPFTLVNQKWFFPSFLLGYWLTNWLGFILLHWGIAGLQPQRKTPMKLRSGLWVAIVYSIVIAALVWMNWIPMPSELIQESN